MAVNADSFLKTSAELPIGIFAQDMDEQSLATVHGKGAEDLEIDLNGVAVILWDEPGSSGSKTGTTNNSSFSIGNDNVQQDRVILNR